MNRKLDCIHRVVKRNPTNVLPSRPDFAADSHFERRQEFCQHSAFACHDWTKAKINDTDARFACGFSRLLPLATDAGQKSATRFALLIQNLVIAVAINTRG